MPKSTRASKSFHQLFISTLTCNQYKSKNVAIKIANKGDTPDNIAKIEGRFVREVAMLSKVQHKNLVKSTDEVDSQVAP
ncbi:hypothetical protein L1887_31385 [Cichorium endivia]|nr:hypothetical protein L1887_31385 [Cichorium endivia]